ncbi:MFS transporter [Streptomyces sp. 15-116A]|uniref:MFS transporter n=1 Tax=Streptomyces sp. 15-116A TaxID=2259035 RepID=UPI0021B42944|nr:MFS transporter [Streptomyces sp. 15-116A]MCT7350806.1 MFS transporter [Streptomyces sp. 15-116A]
MSEATTYRKLLANREFTGLFAAHSVSILGDVLSKVALSVLVYDRTRSAFMTALTFALGFLPQVLTAALASAVVDLLPVRRIMLIGDTIRLLCVLSMTVPGIPVWALLVLVTVSGALTPMFRAARQSMLPEIVGMEGYVLARSMFSGTVQLGQTLGFGLGGLLLVLVTPRTALLLDAATFVFSLTMVLLMVRPRPAAAQRSAHTGGIIRATTRGNWAVLGDPALRRLLLLQWIPTALLVMPEGLAAPYADELGGGTAAVGLLLAAPAVGTVLGEVIVARWMSPAARVRRIPLLVLVAAGPLIGFAIGPSLPVALALLFLSGIGSAFVLPLDQLFVERVPVSLRGRALTLSGAGSIAAQGTALAAGGLLAEWLSLSWVFAAAGTASLASAALLCGRRHWRRSGRSAPMASNQPPLPVDS